MSIIDEGLTRLADRLRAMPESRLSRSDDRLDGESLADACHAFAQWCADSTPEAPAAPVPRLSDLASGDQVLVVGRELINALDAIASPPLVAEFQARLTSLRTLT